MRSFIQALMLAACMALSLPVECTTTSDVFSKYPNSVFIETGSYWGEGIDNALTAGFQRIYSIELSPKYAEHCRQKFALTPSVTIVEGDSAVAIKDILDTLDVRATFWLDGHCSLGDTAKGETMTPILQELEHIKQHHINTHTILIDDLRLFGTSEFDDIPVDALITKLLEINPEYTITYENGHQEYDVLVAYIPQ